MFINNWYVACVADELSDKPLRVRILAHDFVLRVADPSPGVSLETRVPLLDHRVVEFAWRLPLSMKIRGDRRKELLRRVLYQYVPEELIERPKMGFGIPLAEWLREPLRDWTESLLDEARLRREGYFDPEIVRPRWDTEMW